MKIAMMVLGVVIGLGVLVALVGTALPKAHVARRSVMLRQAPESVWNVITDFKAQPSWRKDVTKVELVRLGPDGEVWREEGENTLSFRTTDSRAPERLVRKIADTDLAYGGRWIYELVPQDGGTRVTVTEEGEVYNPIFRFIGHFFLNQAATIESYLTALAQRFGEQPTLQS
ncbi:MAG: SRPBCC family protein [Gemmatimonadaceae bacterium]